MMDRDEAIKELKLIRQMMERASHKFLFSPWQWIEWGLLVMVGCFATWWLQGTGRSQAIYYLWITIFIVGGAVETSIWTKAARRRGLDPFNAFILKLWGVAGLIMLMSLILSGVFASVHQTGYIPGLWLMTMGVIILSFVILADRRDLVLFGLVQLMSGLLAVSLLLSHALLVGFLCFGVGALANGLYLFIRNKA